jgi:hypothetical protein
MLPTSERPYEQVEGHCYSKLLLLLNERYQKLEEFLKAETEVPANNRLKPPSMFFSNPDLTEISSKG